MPRQKLKIAYIPPFHRVHYHALEEYLAQVCRLRRLQHPEDSQSRPQGVPEYLIQELSHETFGPRQGASVQRPAVVT
jgi:hypothetical protein